MTIRTLLLALSLLGITRQVLAAPSCSYMFDASSANVTASGGSGTFGMVTTGGCAWATSESSSWLSGVTASGTGPGSISYTVDVNTGPARSDTITSEGQMFTVNQANGCSVTLTPDSVTLPAGGGTTMFDVTTADDCEWTASTGSDWVASLTASGTGSGAISVEYEANTGPARADVIEVAVASGTNTSFTLDQSSGCVISLPVTSAGATPSGGESSFAVATGHGCEFTVSYNVDWLAARVVEEGVEYTVDAWDGEERSAVLRVMSTNTESSSSFTVTQSSGCTVTLTPGNIRVGPRGGLIDLQIMTGECVISAESESDFITDVEVVGNVVRASIADNPGDERMGSIAISADEATGTFIVMQAAGGGSRPDAGVAADGGSPDAALPGDAGAPGDGGTRFDAGADFDGGLGFDAGYVFEELVVGRGCSCDITARGPGRSRVLGALLFSVLVVVRIGRRRAAAAQRPTRASSRPSGDSR